MDVETIDTSSGNSNHDLASDGNTIDMDSGDAGNGEEESGTDTGTKDFDLALVGECFTACYTDENTLQLGDYLAAYRELCRFFKLMGRIFRFVADDIEDKISNMEALVADYPDNYKTLQSSLEHEVNNNLARQKVNTKKGDVHSGTRTLLRLHRALQFILEFMRRMATSPDEAKTSQIASDVYGSTLARHHNWIIRKMAALAMYTLPNRKELVGKMCKQSYEEANDLVGTVAANGQRVYDCTQKLFEQYELLDIPHYN